MILSETNEKQKKKSKTKNNLENKKKSDKKQSNEIIKNHMGFKFSGLSSALGIGAVASPLTLLGTAGAFGDTAANIGLTMYGMNQQKAAAREDYNRQINMWNMTNDYNSPASQMARYKAAGLNPNLIYGQSNTTSMPNVDATNLNTNFDRVTAMSDAMDGVYTAMDRKDAEEAMKQLQKEKEEAKKRQEIIDARTARAFDMEMKIKEAQYRNLMAKPALEAQKNQVLAQKEIEKKEKKVLNTANTVRRGFIGYGAYKLARSLANRAVGVVFPTVGGAITPALALNYGVQKGIIEPLQTETVGDWLADKGRAVHRFFGTKKSKKGFKNRDGSISY